MFCNTRMFVFLGSVSCQSIFMINYKVKITFRGNLKCVSSFLNARSERGYPFLHRIVLRIAQCTRWAPDPKFFYSDRQTKI
jgi:hypothetical protein